MPLYGTLDLTTVAKTLPTLANLDTEAWILPKAEMLQLLIEVPRSSTDGLLPKAMHPALPSYVILAFTKYSESPAGPFTLASDPPVEKWTWFVTSGNPFASVGMSCPSRSLNKKLKLPSVARRSGPHEYPDWLGSPISRTI